MIPVASSIRCSTRRLAPAFSIREKEIPDDDHGVIVGACRFDNIPMPTIDRVGVLAVYIERAFTLDDVILHAIDEFQSYLVANFFSQPILIQAVQEVGLL